VVARPNDTGLGDQIVASISGTALSDQASPLAITCRGFISDTDEFLEPAQRHGKAQPGVRGRDLFLGALATSWAGAVATQMKPAEDVSAVPSRHALCR
jgi:hypothetical protein